MISKTDFLTHKHYFGQTKSPKREKIGPRHVAVYGKRKRAKFFAAHAQICLFSCTVAMQYSEPTFLRSK